MVEVLRDELLVDPLSRGYSTMSDQEASDDLNTIYRTLDRETIETWEIFEATVKAEYGALSTADKRLYETILSMGSVNVKGGNTRASLAVMFGAGTTTRTNLIALQTVPVSRAEELGILVKPGLVEEVRRP